MFIRTGLRAVVAALFLGALTAGNAAGQTTVKSAKVAKNSARSRIMEASYERGAAKQLLLEAAMTLLERAVELKPEDAEIWYMLGALNAEREMVDEMNEHFAKCLELKKGDKFLKKGVGVTGGSPYLRGGINFTRQQLWTGFFNKGVRSLNGGKADEAIANFKTAIKVTPDHPATYKALGKVYVNYGRDSLDTALDYFTQALAIDSTQADVHTDLGIVLLNSKRYDESAARLEKAHELAPENVQVIRFLASARWGSGDKEGAIDAATNALKINPNDPQILALVGGIYADLRDFEQAVTYLERAFEANPEDEDVKFNLANAYLGAGSLEDAESLFVKSVEANPNDHQALYLLGSILDQTGKYDDAIGALEKVVGLKPKLAKGWGALSNAYAHKSNATSGEEARAMAKKADEAHAMFESLSGGEE